MLPSRVAAALPAWLRRRAPSPTRVGSLTLITLLLVGVTGAFLAFSYAPDPHDAHASVQAMTAGVAGWIRAAHAWGATAVLVLAFLHLARSWVSSKPGTFKVRRWSSGLLALAVLLAAFLSGTILAWDHKGWESLQHVQYGAELVRLELLDDRAPHDAPLFAVFLMHVLTVPAILLLVLAFHLKRDQAIPAQARRLWAVVSQDARVTLTVLALVGGLALVASPLHGPAPIPGITVSKPAWPFLWLVPVQDAFGASGILLLPLGFILLGGVFFLGRNWSIRARVITLWFGLLTTVALGLIGAF